MNASELSAGLFWDMAPEWPRGKPAKCRLARYKTAFTPLHDQYVEIKRIHYDSRGEAIIVTLMGGRKMLFREFELTKYCL